MDEVTCGWSLLRLLRVLRRTVLPAHWVPVLAAGPLLQLLQCSKVRVCVCACVHVCACALYQSLEGKEGSFLLGIIF